ncbi:uncharacterized protein LOC126901883 [Daktulosphaira vitifoliae]|uniref:uncharacterized protein LOC126901883 n=1 Tax=Daktulosphaira vitifoliae TaxID=58002 RepID=UPI0021AA2D69|nr:uncharacterized protein LOC126901883 [Daktulosphaira vitifoliae]
MHYSQITNLYAVNIMWSVKFVVITAFVASTQAQQRIETPTILRPQSRIINPLNLEAEDPLPQPFRRPAVPLFRGRGFSLDGQEPKFVPIDQPTHPTFSFENDKSNSDESSNSNSNSESKESEDDKPNGQPTARQTLFQYQSQPERNQQQPPQFPGFRAQTLFSTQSQPTVQIQPQLPKKTVQRPFKRVQVPQSAEQTAAAKVSEKVHKVKIERTESDKSRNKKPVSQVLRRYRDDNSDGSITWGFENDDGTFKEETIGVDCVTRGKYGYIDPEGVKREYSYQSGIPCDKKLSETNVNGRSTVEAQASESHGYIDYSKNQYVMANGQTVSLNGMVKNRARKPIRKTSIIQVLDSNRNSPENN